MNRNDYDVIIIGAGPAGIFAALELIQNDSLKVLVLERGPDIDERSDIAQKNQLDKKRLYALTQGWGGAGAFSDGKLTLTSEIGGWLTDYVNRDILNELIDYIDNLYIRFGAPKKFYGADEEKIEEIQKKATLADLRLIPSRIRHLGTDRCLKVLKAFREFLNGRVEIITGIKVEEILVEKGKVKGVRTKAGDEYQSENVIVAPGRSGSKWLTSEAQRLKLDLRNNAVDIGIRVEAPAVIMEPLTAELYESKLIYYSKSFEDMVRTFCMNPYGVVSTELTDGIITVNGHSYSDQRTHNTNFALLVSTNFTEPFKEPISYGRYIASLANILGEGIIIQRLGDLEAGRRSTPSRVEKSTVKPTLPKATPGDLSFVLPYRVLADIKEMLVAMNSLTPGIYSSNTLLYGVEVKFYSSRLKLTNKLETDVKGLYAIGDGAGITRGLVQSSCSGVIAARGILEK